MNIFMQKIFFDKVLLTSFVMYAVLLTGCATPATSVGMTPTNYDIVNKNPDTVSISVEGGSETSAIWKTQISNEEFSLALIDAIKSSQTFSTVITGAGADYLLHINLFSIEQPTFGTSLTVRIEIGWTLKRLDNNVIVWQESIKSEHIATVKDALSGAARLRLATEGAARDNIRRGLAKISMLNLQVTH